MNLDERYSTIMKSVEQDHRGLVRYSAEEVDELVRLLASKKDLEKVLFLIEHSAMPNQAFEEGILAVLKAEIPDHLIIFSLNAARKHILQARFNKGHRLEFEFLEALKILLHHRNPEVVEWTLRTIEECGNQGVYFLSDLDKIKPAPWKWFNAHQRAVRELIELLERRWRRFEKPESERR